MTTPADRWRAVSARLDEVLALDEAAARAEYLARLSAEDAGLAEEVAVLLAASGARDDLLDTGPDALAARLVAPSQESPPPERIGPWRVVGVLGEGGMGRVFAAERAGEGFVQRAAVKMLHGGGAPTLLRERFLAERRILAELEHPAIARMLDGGVDAGGAPYLAMERVDGARVTDFCRAQRLPVERRLKLFREICAAVEYAHRRRIVHRDLKPSNILVDGEGRVKLLDFGIAKLLAGGEEASDAPTLLRALTPQYAAPEQATGGEVTPATDVYALGVLLHELLAGRLPATRGDGTPFTVEQALARGEPLPLSRAAVVDASRPEGDKLQRRLAGDLERIVARAMALDPGQRYASPAALAEDLRRHLAGEPVEARGGGLFYRAGRRLSRHRWAAVAALSALVALALAAHLATRSPPTPPRLAVLPFEAHGSAEPYRAGALAEEIATVLGRSRDLAVLSSTSLAGRGSGTLPAAQLRRELGATHALHGRLDGVGDSLRVSLSLGDVASERLIWVDAFAWSAAPQPEVDRAVVARIAAQVLSALDLPWKGAGDGTAPTRDPRAYEAYLRGLAELSGRSPAGVGPEQRVAATVQLELAVALDPGFAEAWARLGTVYAKRLYHDAPSPDLEARSFVAVQRALALDPELAEAYLARAQLSWTLPHGFDHEGAVADLERALERHPSLAEAHQELCKVYFHVGLTERAVAECDRALALDPLDRTAFGRKVSVLADAARDAEVVALLESRGGELSPGIRAGMLVDIGRNEEALALLLGEGAGVRPRDPEFGWPSSSRAALERIWAAIALARLGRREEAAAQLARAEFTAATVAEESHLHHAYYFAGVAHALLGNRDEALRWLTRAADEGYPSYPRFARDGDLVALSGDPRFVALLARLERDWQRWQREL